MRCAFAVSAVLSAVLVLPAPRAAAQGALAPETVAPPAPAPPAGLALGPNHAWTVGVGTGLGSYMEIADVIFLDLAEIGGYETRRTNRMNVNLRVGRPLGRWLSAGVAYSYFRYTREYSRDGVVAGRKDYAGHILLGDLTLVWIRRPHVELYSGLAVGGATMSERGGIFGDTPERRVWGPAFQLRLLGLAVGGERFRVFGEVGTGFESFLLVGASMRL